MKHRSPFLRLSLGAALCATALITSPAWPYPRTAAPRETVNPRLMPRAVYTCPAAGCDYESARAGVCPKHKLKLQKVDVTYTCPVDQKPVAHGGPCPRCAANAVEHRMAVADSKPAHVKPKKAVHAAS